MAGRSAGQAFSRGALALVSSTRLFTTLRLKYTSATGKSPCISSRTIQAANQPFAAFLTSPSARGSKGNSAATRLTLFFSVYSSPPFNSPFYIGRTAEPL